MNETSQASEAERLLALRQTGALDRPLPSEIAAICREARARFGVPIALVTLIERDRQVVIAGEGTDLREQPRRDAFCDWTIQEDRVLVVPDLQRDSRFAENRLVAGPPHMRFYAGAPLTYLQGIRLGTLCLLDTRPRRFTPGEQAELVALAEEVVGVLAREEFAGVPGG